MITKSYRSPLTPTTSYKKIVKLMKVRPFICTSISANNAKGFVAKTTSAAKLGSDLAELRIDFLKNQDPENVKKIIKSSCLPLIVTNRNKENRGMFPSGNEEKRLELLYESLDAKPAFIDIELHTEEKDRTDLINAAHKKGVGIICSYHDFQNTPSTKEIISIFKQVAKTKADMAKLVFTPHTNKDVRNILEAVEFVRYSEIPSTIFGMGDVGQHTRILSPVLGSCLTYCAVKVDPNNGLAQISVKDTRSIFDVLISKKKSWTSIRKEHKELLTFAIAEFMSKESYPFIGRLIEQ